MITIEFKNRKEYFSEVKRLVSSGVLIKTSISKERGVIKIIGDVC